MILHYVYTHYDADGKPFYVGMGKGRRAMKTHNRTKEWLAVASKGYSIEIEFVSTDRDLVIMLERCLIKAFGRKDLNLGTLVNMTNGGETGTEGHLMNEQHRTNLIRANTTRKPVIHIPTGIVYNSIKEAAGVLHVNPNTLQYRLIRKSPNTEFRYASDQSPRPVDKRIRTLVNRDTGEVYSSIKDAAVNLSINYSTLRYDLSKGRECIVRYNI